MIRESGSVEQDADVILFLYREAYYNKESQDHSLEIIISKNRNGPVGSLTVKLQRANRKD
jgi:replicative DNA helicase